MTFISFGCIIVLKKNKSDNNILFIDATDECIPNTNKMKNATNNNKLSDVNIDNIISLIKDRSTIDKKTYLATYDEVTENDYNLSINSYIKSNEEKSNIDIKEVNSKLLEVVPRQQKIREELEKIIPGIEYTYDEVGMFAKEEVTLTGEDKEVYDKLYGLLDAIDDVSAIYTNVKLD